MAKDLALTAQAICLESPPMRHVVACVNRANGQLVMSAVQNRDIDGFDIGVVQQLVMVGESLCGANSFSERACSRRIA